MFLTKQIASIAAALLLILPASAADLYKIDPTHTSITFSVRHLGINSVKGGFKDFSGWIAVENDTLVDASGTIQTKSVDTGVTQRDDHLRSADFFDVAKYPTITFKAKRIKKKPLYSRHKLPDGRVTIVADFTMRGVTREVRLPAKLTGPATDPWGNVRIGLEAKAKLNRRDYGINFNQALETGALLVGEEVELVINAEAIKTSVK